MAVMSEKPKLPSRMPEIPEGAVQVGTHTDGRPIWKAMMRNPKRVATPAVNEEGKPLHRPNPDGSRGKRVNEFNSDNPEKIEREFVQDEISFGKWDYNFNFRPTEETLARMEQERQREARMEKLLAAVDRPDFEAFISSPAPAASSTDVDTPEDPAPVQTEGQAPELRKKHTGFGYYDVMFGDEKLNDKRLSSEEADEQIKSLLEQPA